jgi:hypothetical protein
LWGEGGDEEEDRKKKRKKEERKKRKEKKNDSSIIAVTNSNRSGTKSQCTIILIGLCVSLKTYLTFSGLLISSRKISTWRPCEIIVLCHNGNKKKPR